MIRDLLIKHEKLVRHAYQDSEGYWTIGVGRLIDKRRGGGLTRAEAMYLLDNDIRRVEAEAATLPWFSGLDEVRRVAVLDMLFNLGLPKFLGFKKTIAAIERKDWEKAAVEMLDSKWATQVGTRAWDLAHMMKTGQMKGT